MNIGHKSVCLGTLTDWPLSPGKLNQLDWANHLLTSIENYRCHLEIGEFSQVEDVFTLKVPVYIATINLVTDTDSAQGFQWGRDHILGHMLEVVPVSGSILGEDFVELSSTLLREDEGVDFRVDEDARAHVVRTVYVGVILKSLLTGLSASVSLRTLLHVV